MADSQIKVELIDYMGNDLTVTNAARVSFDKESEWDWDECGVKSSFTGESRQVLKEKDKKLIQYLAKHVHLSPFGHCFASFRVTAPVFVSRQLVKHKFLRINEVSRRYVDTPPEFYVPDVWREKADNKKQGSANTEHPMTCEVVEAGIPYPVDFKGWLESNYTSTLDLYNMMIKEGVCPEQARMILPQSMMTSWYWSGSMDAFAAMCHLRLKEGAQYETRIVAEEIDAIMSTLYPVSWEALRAYAE